MDCAVTKPILLPRALAARKVCSRCRYVNKRKLIEEENPLSSFAKIANFYQSTKFFAANIYQIKSYLRLDTYNTAAPLPRTKIEEDHSEEDQCEVEGFAAEVLFLEDQGSEEEADYDAAAADHGDDGNHRAGH